MFLDYRIRRLQIKVDVQKALTDKLEITEKEYGRAYYTDKFHKAHCQWLELNSKLQWLKDKKSKSSTKAEE
jgi:hypothetical protein